jgi:hypothetical protein
MFINFLRHALLQRLILQTVQIITSIANSADHHQYSLTAEYKKGILAAFFGYQICLRPSSGMFLGEC